MLVTKERYPTRLHYAVTLRPSPAENTPYNDLLLRVLKDRMNLKVDVADQSDELSGMYIEFVTHKQDIRSFMHYLKEQCEQVGLSFNMKRRTH